MIEAELSPSMDCEDRAQIRATAEAYLQRVAYTEAEKRRRCRESRRQAVEAALANPYIAAIVRLYSRRVTARA